MSSKKLSLIFLFILIVFLAAGCIPGNGSSTSEDPSGFFSGVWHGWIAPISLVWGLFNPSIRVYEVFNTGWWYDFGFYIAIIGGFGGLAFIRRRPKGKD